MILSSSFPGLGIFLSRPRLLLSAWLLAMPIYAGDVCYIAAATGISYSHRYWFDRLWATTLRWMAGWWGRWWWESTDCHTF